jgi:hypothetical protein
VRQNPGANSGVVIRLSMRSLHSVQNQDMMPSLRILSKRRGVQGFVISISEFAHNAIDSPTGQESDGYRHGE